MVTAKSRKTTLPIAPEALAAELAKAVKGEVRFDDGSRALYATDSSNYRQVPIGVVVPRDAEDVVATFELCRHRDAPVLARGGGTSLAGQCCNEAVVIDCSKYMNRILEIDPDKKIARVQPGLVLDRLRRATEEHGLTYGPDPSTHDHCTFGGMIGNNSCGVHSVMAGKTVDNVDELEILTYDGLRTRVGETSDLELRRLIRGGGRAGEIYSDLAKLRDRYADEIRERFPKLPRRVSGYNLDQLLPEHGFHVARSLVGAESSCAFVLEATVRLVPWPAHRVLAVLSYPDVYTAADDVPEVLTFGPMALEGLGEKLVADFKTKGQHLEWLRLLPEGGGWLLAEFGGDTVDAAKAGAQKLVEAFHGRPGAGRAEVLDKPGQEQMLWDIREAGLGSTANVPGKPLTWEGWEDSAVPPDQLGPYLREFRRLLESYDYHGDFYGHFGDGCLHTRINFDLRTDAGIAKYRSFAEHAADLVVSHGGSLSGEHGDGQSRAELLPRMFGPQVVRAFEEFKGIWDPGDRMNPGKKVRPYRLDENLRLGAGYQDARPPTHFKFPDDDGSFGRAALRCVGVGNCRRHDAGTMCPSYQATGEEMHSTRGRAHLLFEMLQGNTLGDGWRDESVREALDLCLACKGCKGECPVNVDMATYKAEFLSHYYSGRLRPAAAYAFGLIFWWARIGSLAPRLTNLMTQTPLLAKLGKRVIGVAPERRLPPFSTESFRKQFHGHHSPGTRVLLWLDTFNSHFHSEVLTAAVSVLEDAGCTVKIPDRHLCCGRPLYDYGMLNLAKRQLRQILRRLRTALRAGMPIVVLEPSCASVFREELLNFWPDDPDAQRLSRQTFVLSEFLEQLGYEPPRRQGRVLLHGHCHHKSVLDFNSERSLLEKMGLEIEAPDSGCCGMAGAFGFEEQHYDVSVKCGERVLLPAVRGAAGETPIVTDGFSCREQITQLTDRRPLHLAEFLQQSIDGAKEVTRP